MAFLPHLTTLFRNALMLCGCQFTVKLILMNSRGGVAEEISSCPSSAAIALLGAILPPRLLNIGATSASSPISPAKAAA